MNIAIKKEGGKVVCVTPYHPAFPAAARDLGGSWVSPKWVFDDREESAVRDLCLDIWGTDGSLCKLVTLRVVASGAARESCGKDSEIYIAGRRVAFVYDNSGARARLGDGVVLTSGRLFGGGSHKRPCIQWSDGTAFEVRDVPIDAAKKVVARAPELVDILESPLSPVINEVAVSDAALALMEERRIISGRLIEIDRALLELMPVKRDIAIYGVDDDLLDKD